MKKIMAIVLALLLVGCAALAEAAAQDAGFVFRNGITWGMTPEQVAAAENNPDADAYDDEALCFMKFEDVEALAGLEGDANYIFLNHALVVCGYQFDVVNADLETVLAAMTAEYGEPTDSDPAALNAMLGNLYDSTDELADDAFFAGWTLPDGTYVGMTDSFGDIEVAFLDVAVLNAEVE